MGPIICPPTDKPKLHVHLMSFNVFQEPKSVVILILDANDHIPLFDSSSYDFTIPEVSPLKDAFHIFVVVFVRSLIQIENDQRYCYYKAGQ